MSISNSPTRQLEVSDTVEALSYLEELRSILTAKTNPDLEKRIHFDRTTNKIKLVLQHCMALMVSKDIVQTEKVVDEREVPNAPTNVPVSLSRPVSASAKQTNEDLGKAVVSYAEFLEIIKNYIPNADKTIISFNTIIPHDRQSKNVFDGAVQTLKVVFSTNSEAYVVSQRADGTYSLTPSKYWVQQAQKD